ncbi:hypothetical protein [Puniceibacterium sediminis]|nr:hypothetical protein [Puniceibacterium sediminis]
MATFWSLLVPFVAQAEIVSLFDTNTFLQDRRALIPASAPTESQTQEPRRVASLFAGQAGGSLFAPWPDRTVAKDTPFLLGPDASVAERIRHLIGQAESRHQGYNAVQHGAKRLPPARPTEMTLAEIYQWISDTPGQPHAIGRYQFIPVTLKRLVIKTGTDLQQVFSPRLQDRLADVLLVEAGLHTFGMGKIGREKFMNNLAGIWAGLPTSNGKSYYHGFAGNRATMTWDRFDQEMARIFPG